MTGRERVREGVTVVACVNRQRCDGCSLITEKTVTYKLGMVRNSTHDHVQGVWMVFD